MFEKIIRAVMKAMAYVLIFFLPLSIVRPFIPAEDFLPPASTYPYPPMIWADIFIFLDLPLKVIMPFLFVLLAIGMIIMSIISLIRSKLKLPKIDWYHESYTWALLLQIIAFPVIFVSISLSILQKDYYYVPEQHVAGYIKQKPSSYSDINYRNILWNDIDLRFMSSADYSDWKKKYYRGYKFYLYGSGDQALESLIVKSINVTTDRGKEFEAFIFEASSRSESKEPCHLPCNLSNLKIKSFQFPIFEGGFFPALNVNPRSGEVVTSEITFEMVTKNGVETKVLKTRWVPIRATYSYCHMCRL